MLSAPKDKLLATAVLALGCIVSAATGVRAQSTATNAARKFAAAKSPDEARALVDKVSRLDPRDVQAIMHQDDDGAALLAAWMNMVRSGTPDQPPAVSARQRFLGFVEGRLRLSPPRWWQELVLGAQYAEHSNRFDFAPPTALDTYEKTAVVFGSQPLPARITKGTKLVRAGDNFVFSQQGKPTSVSARALSELGDHFFPPDFDLLDGEQGKYLACHTGAGFQFFLARINEKNGELEWKSRVWATDEQQSRKETLKIEMVPNRNRIYVFGAESYGVFIEGFVANTGANEFRFCSRYYDPERGY